MMIELIDARRGLHDKCLELFTDKKIAEDIYCKLCDGIDECETFEVKRGHWVLNERGIYECSICGRVPTAEEKQYDRYCSWCGAKMEKTNEAITEKR